MGKRIVWDAQARAQIRAIDHTMALRILHTLARFVNTGEGDVKRLQDIVPPESRLRAGDCRLRFRESAETIEVLAVKHRSEAYR